MKRKDPEEPNGWDFEVDGGKQNIKGKPQWPDVINLWIPRRHAFELIESLIIQLGNEKKDIIHYAFCGNLKLEEDD